MTIESMAMVAAIYRTYGGVAGITLLVLHVIVIISVLAGNGSSRHKLVWTGAILLLPVIGLILYVVWGRSRRDRPLLE